MGRLQIAQYIAAGASIVSIIGFFVMSGGHNAGVLMLVLGCFAGLVSYIFGGLGTAIKMAGGIAKWGLLFGPFPTNIMFFVVTFISAIYIFLFLPIIPIRKAYKECI